MFEANKKDIKPENKFVMKFLECMKTFYSRKEQENLIFPSPQEIRQIYTKMFHHFSLGEMLRYLDWCKEYLLFFDIENVGDMTNTTKFKKTLRKL